MIHNCWNTNSKRKLRNNTSIARLDIKNAESLNEYPVIKSTERLQLLKNLESEENSVLYSMKTLEKYEKTLQRLEPKP